MHRMWAAPVAAAALAGRTAGDDASGPRAPQDVNRDGVVVDAVVDVERLVNG
jgi:hypothetical protein